MQGNYISNRSRLQLAHQSRKSHFEFGRTGHAYSTSQNSCVRADKFCVTPVRSSNCRTASHFALGNESTRSRSEFSRNYRSHTVERRKPQPLVKELNPSSVVLGTQRIRFSLTSGELRDLTGSRIESYNNTPQKNRKSNFEMGKDKPTLNSLMQKDFQKTLPEKPFKIEKTLLDSHITLGTHPKSLQSTSKNEYFRKQGPPGSLNSQQLKNIKQEHFILGQDQKAKITTNHSSFQPFQICKQGLPESNLSSLKSSHFSFNSEKPSYISESKESLNYVPSEQRTQENYLKQNHITLGNSNPKTNSTYRQNHHFRSQSVNNPLITKNDELKTNLVLGTTSELYQTTTDAKMTGKYAQALKLDKNYERYLRYHHNSLGDGKPVYDLKHKNYGTGQPDPSHFLQGHKIDLLTTHWQTGKEDVKLTSSMKNNFQNLRSERRTQENYLKAHNYRLGDSQNDWKTSYAGKFKWIQPVPVNNVKFSFN